MSQNNKIIENRVIEVCNYIIDNNATVRATAKKFGVSKSTIHKDANERINDINFTLSNKVKSVLAFNMSDRHIRGGLATKNKYANA